MEGQRGGCGTTTTILRTSIQLFRHVPAGVDDGNHGAVVHAFDEHCLAEWWHSVFSGVDIVIRVRARLIELVGGNSHGDSCHGIGSGRRRCCVTIMQYAIHTCCTYHHDGMHQSYDKKDNCLCLVL